MKDISRFHDALADIPATAAGIKEKGRDIIGYLCSYAPEELIFAAGFHPMRLFSSKSDILLAENHLQAYCCSLVRGVLEDSLSGRLDFLTGTVFPHTCDSIQRLSDIWRLDKRYQFFADLVLPVKLNTQSARTYMADVLQRFKKEIETAAGKDITSEDLQRSIHVFNTIRDNLGKIYRLQSQNPGIIKGQDLLALIKGAMVMDREEVADCLPRIAADLENAACTETNAKRLVVSGSICDSPDIYSAIEEAGGVIVADDLCTGQRGVEGLISEDTDPMAAIAERYLTRINCPAKHGTLTGRADHLLSLARENKADGVIFMLLKFCDPHAFDYPFLKEPLEKEGIKTLLIEMDDQQQSLGQLSTRIETFLHMI